MDTFPDLIIRHITNYLDVYSFIKLSLTCRRLFNVCNEINTICNNYIDNLYGKNWSD